MIIFHPASKSLGVPRNGLAATASIPVVVLFLEHQAENKAQTGSKVRRRPVIMDMSHSSGDEPRPDSRRKKCYEKPDVRYEQVFETTALSCGKVTGGESNLCHMNKKS